MLTTFTTHIVPNDFQPDALYSLKEPRRIGEKNEKLWTFEENQQERIYDLMRDEEFMVSHSDRHPHWLNILQK